jgi:hypothetical protein
MLFTTVQYCLDRSLLTSPKRLNTDSPLFFPRNALVYHSGGSWDGRGAGARNHPLDQELGEISHLGLVRRVYDRATDQIQMRSRESASQTHGFLRTKMDP